MGNIFEIAMKMEEDGRAYYLDYAARTDSPELKRVLTELADDELKHYNIFKALRDGQSAEYKEEQKTTIFATVKNVFETLKAEGKDKGFTSEARDVWDHAREVEKKSEAFYREKADEVGDDNQKKILDRIADEERRHWVTIENVMQFLDRPQQWLEAAEWNNLESY